MFNYKVSLASREGSRRRITAVVVAVGLLPAALLLGGCGLFGGGDDHGGESVPLAAEPMHRRARVQRRVRAARADRVIRVRNADVVGVLESYNRLPEMARRTGYPYYNVSLQILSKYPILEPSGGGGLYALIEVKPGYVVPFFNQHLDDGKWGRRALRRGDRSRR